MKPNRQLLGVVLGLGVLIGMSVSLSASELLVSRGNDAQTTTDRLHVVDLLLESKHFSAARRLAQKISGKGGDSREAALRLAMAEFFEKPATGSPKVCRQFAKNKAATPLAALCRGEYWMAHGNARRALEAFTEAAGTSTDVRGIVGLGRAHEASDDLERALAAYRKAASSNVGHYPWLGIGRILAKTGDTSGANNALVRAVELEPDSSLARFHLGRLLERGKDAIDHLKHAVALRPEWADAWGALGAAQLASDNAPAAQLAYEKALALDGDNADFWEGLARSYAGQNKPAKAREAIAQVLDRDDSRVDTLLLQARLEAAANNHFRASELLSNAVALSGNRPEVHMQAALVYYELERHTRANSYFLKVLSMDSQNSLVLSYLAKIACSRNMYKEGQTYYRQALRGDLVGVKKSELTAQLNKCRPTSAN